MGVCVVSVVLLDGLLLLCEFELLEHLLDLLVLEQPVEDDACVYDKRNEEQTGQSYPPIEPSILRTQLHPYRGAEDQFAVEVVVFYDEEELLEELLTEVDDKVYVLVDAGGVVHAGGQLLLAGVAERCARGGGRGRAVHHPPRVASLSLRGLVVEVDQVVLEQTVLVYVQEGLNACLAQVLIGLGGQAYN